MNTNGWEQLDCQFFAETCRRVLSSYLETNGFKERKKTVSGGLIYTRCDLFLEISYDTNLFPNYTIRVIVGLGKGAYDNCGGFSGVPIWYILPKDHPYRTKVYWTFKTEKELEKVLGEIKDQFLETTMQSLLLNYEGLERVIKNFQAEFC